MKLLKISDLMQKDVEFKSFYTPTNLAGFKIFWVSKIFFAINVSIIINSDEDTVVIENIDATTVYVLLILEHDTTKTYIVILNGYPNVSYNFSVLR